MGAIRGTGEAKLGGVPLQISALQLLLFFPPHQLAARTIRAIHPPAIPCFCLFL
jgi:hypothetical protein